MGLGQGGKFSPFSRVNKPISDTLGWTFSILEENGFIVNTLVDDGVEK
jgi:hypothetical protein